MNKTKHIHRKLFIKNIKYKIFKDILHEALSLKNIKPKYENKT